MSRIRSCVILIVLLVSCGEPYSDAGEACLVPTNCTACGKLDACDPPDGETVGYTEFAKPFCTEGDFPADVRLTVAIGVPGSDSELVFEKCEVEKTGDFELTVHSKWRKRERIAVGETSWFECETPPLAAGDWTIHYGDSSADFTVPSELRGPVCVDAGF